MYGLATRCITGLPILRVVGGEGFEPPQPKQATGLQPAAIDQTLPTTHVKPTLGLEPSTAVYKTAALPDKLSRLSNGVLICLKD